MEKKHDSMWGVGYAKTVNGPSCCICFFDEYCCCISFEKGEGTSVKCWHDLWCGDQTLEDFLELHCT